MRRRLELTAEQRAQLRQAAEQLVDQVETDNAQSRCTSTTRRPYPGSRYLSLSAEGRSPLGKPTTDFYDFGVDVDVVAPPASQVFDVTKQLQSG